MGDTIKQLVTTRTWSRNQVLLLVGIVDSDGRVSWGECVGRADTALLEQLLADKIAPVLVGRPTSDFYALSAAVEALTYTVTHTRTIEPEPGMSRRGILSLTGLVEPERAQIETEIETRPLPAPLRYGISHALYNLSPPSLATHERTERLQLQGAFRSNQLSAVNRLVLERVPIIGVTAALAAAQDEAISGQLQNLVRQVVGRIGEVAPADYTPTIQLDAKGFYGRLLSNSGKIAGAMYGLMKAARPYPVRVIDPVLDVATMREVVEAIKFRKMENVEVGATVRTTAELAQWEAQSAHFLVFPAAVIGSLATLITLAQTSQLPFMIGCDAAETAHTLPHLLHIADHTNCIALLTLSQESRHLAHNVLVRREIEKRVEKWAS